MPHRTHRMTVLTLALLLACSADDGPDYVAGDAAERELAGAEQRAPRPLGGEPVAPTRAGVAVADARRRTGRGIEAASTSASM